MGRGAGGKRKDHSGNVDFISKELSFFTMVTNDDTGIASEVDLKMSTVKPLHAFWAISGFRKVGLLYVY